MHRVSDGLAFVSALFFAIAAYPRANRASRAAQIPRRPKSLGKSVYHFINCSVFGLNKKYVYIYIYMLYQSGEHNLTKCWVSVGSIELMGMINYFFRMVCPCCVGWTFGLSSQVVIITPVRRVAEIGEHMWQDMQIRTSVNDLHVYIYIYINALWIYIHTYININICI